MDKKDRKALLDQIERWHRKDKAHQQIVDAIEALPAAERDYELTNLLARAYNNLATMEDQGRPALERATALLESVTAEGEGDATWHYRLGYSLFYLDREEEALAHFQRALELDPEEADVAYFIDRCRRTIAAQERTDAPTGAAEHLYVTLTLNARFQPQHRHDLEDVLNEVLEEAEIGEVDGGGTLLEPSGEVKSCDIVIKLWMEDYIDNLMSLLDALMIPKGSVLHCGEGRDFPVGQDEGLGLYLNGTELPDQVYRDCDINFVLQRLGELLGEEGQLYSWWEGPRDTALYFYGPSYEGMLAAIRDFLETYPLCQKCVVSRIA